MTGLETETLKEDLHHILRQERETPKSGMTLFAHWKTSSSDIKDKLIIAVTEFTDDASDEESPGLLSAHLEVTKKIRTA